MTGWALVKDGNVLHAVEGPVPPYLEDASGLKVASPQVGDTYDSGYSLAEAVFDAAPPNSYEADPAQRIYTLQDGKVQVTRVWAPIQTAVPAVMPRLWLIRAMRELNLKAAFDEWMKVQSADLQEDWNACTEVRRDDALTSLAKTPPLSWTDVQLDQLWVEANGLCKAS